MTARPRPLAPAELPARLAGLPGWELVEDGRKLRRRFAFPDYGRAFAFVAEVSALAEARNHHPDVAFGWGYCTLTYWTHTAGGLTELDFEAAAAAGARFRG